MNENAMFKKNKKKMFCLISKASKTNFHTAVLNRSDFHTYGNTDRNQAYI